MIPFRIRDDIGIDLGTATCIVYVKGREIVVSEPSVVAVNADTGEIICDGEAAKKMIGRAPANIRVSRPLCDGVISQYELTLRMLKRYIKAACSYHLLPPRVVVCVPSKITEVEERSVVDAARNAGAGDVLLIEEPVAAAIGAGIDISGNSGHMVVDIGGGTTDIAVLAHDGVVISESIKVAGNKLDDSIKNYVRVKYNLLIGDLTAEEVKLRIGNVYRQQNTETYRVRGKCLASGVPKEVTLRSTEMLEAMLSPITAIIDSICKVIERIPPNMVSDIMNNGIVLTGGGALLRGLDRLITEVTGIRTYVAKNPVNCVAIGTGKSIESLHRFSAASVNILRTRNPKN